MRPRPAAPARFTVLGASGFIGGHLCRYLAARGHAVAAPPREAPLACPDPAGHVIYAIGLTADFRTRPLDTMEAHVTLLSEVLRGTRFDSFLYLSSTRVYGGAAAAREDVPVTVDPAAPDALYDLSKLAGEALCHVHPHPAVRIARLANVYGDGPAPAGSRDFLPEIVRAAAAGRIELQSTLDSAKDYIAIDDVCRALERIALAGRARLYNVAAGRNVTHREIVELLARETGCAVAVAEGAPTRVFPPIEVARIAALFAGHDPGWAPAALLERLPDIVTRHRGRVPALAGACA